MTLRIPILYYKSHIKLSYDAVHLIKIKAKSATATHF